jgi:hypothetical protein
MHAWTFRETSIDIVLNTVVDEIVLGLVENIVQNVSYLRWSYVHFSHVRRPARLCQPRSRIILWDVGQTKGSQVYISYYFCIYLNSKNKWDIYRLGTVKL